MSIFGVQKIRARTDQDAGDEVAFYAKAFALIAASRNRPNDPRHVREHEEKV